MRKCYDTSSVDTCFMLSQTIIGLTYISGKPIGYQMRSSLEGFNDNEPTTA
jgi:hypothetical protein